MANTPEKRKPRPVGSSVALPDEKVEDLVEDIGTICLNPRSDEPFGKKAGEELNPDTSLRFRGGDKKVFVVNPFEDIDICGVKSNDGEWIVVDEPIEKTGPNGIHLCQAWGEQENEVRIVYEWQQKSPQKSGPAPFKASDNQAVNVKLTIKPC
jgi:hypothetical protein